MGKFVPVEINHVRAERKVCISWQDGHAGDYALEYLRGYCPCALCQGHGAASERSFIPVLDAELSEINGVGNYAIEFRWQDGHGTGIYTYDYLRELCPCVACKGVPEESLPKKGVADVVTKEQIYEVLGNCYDPEIPVSIVELGLIYDVDVNDDKVAVKMTLTTPGCGMGGYIASEAQQKILEIPSVSEATVDVVWDPPWDPSRISEQAKQKLGIA